MIIIILLKLEFRGQTVAHYHINGVNNLDLIACPLRSLLPLQLHHFSRQPRGEPVYVANQSTYEIKQPGCIIKEKINLNIRIIIMIFLPFVPLISIKYYRWINVESIGRPTKKNES